MHCSDVDEGFCLNHEPEVKTTSTSEHVSTSVLNLLEPCALLYTFASPSTTESLNIRSAILSDLSRSVSKCKASAGSLVFPEF